MSDEGYEVYAPRYQTILQSFTTGSGTLTEPQVIDDIRTVVAWMQPRWRERVTLVGWSEGAGLAVLGAAAPNRSALYNGVVVFGLPEQAELGWTVRDDITYITGGDPDEPMFDVNKYLQQVGPLPFALLHSSGDQFISREVTDKQFAAIQEPKKFTEVQADSHSFSGNEDGFGDSLIESLSGRKNAPEE